MKNVSNIKNCFGCGVCAIACAKNAIKIELNKNGFYTPVLDATKCTNCGLCSEVCAFLHKELASDGTVKKAYAAWSNNKQVQRKCSSGGIGYEIAKQQIERGYKLCGCRYNTEAGRAEHYIATTPEEAIASI